MKKFLLTICLATAVIFFSGCKKDTDDLNPLSLDSLIGSWELRQAQTGMIPTINYPAKNGNMLKFTASGYEKYKDGTLIKSGGYTLVQDNSVQKTVGLEVSAGQFGNRIIFDNDANAPKTFIDVANQNLRLLSGYFPLDSGSSLVYAKMQ